MIRSICKATRRAKLLLHSSFSLLTGCYVIPYLIVLNPGFVSAEEALPPQANLLLNKEEIASLRTKVTQGEWVAVWKKYRDQADQAVSAEVKLPPRGGNYSHNYVCPDHQVSLKTGKQIGEWEWEHICPIGPHILRGDPTVPTRDFDGNALSTLHSQYAETVRDLGVVYQVTGEAKYATKARDIIHAYAEKYLTYPIRDQYGKPKKGARINAISLSEAAWMVSFLQGVDLVWRTMDAKEQRQLETQLLRPSIAEIIMPVRPIVHNIHCWYDSAIGLAGYLLADKKMIDYAIDDSKDGMRIQLSEGINQDGMWYEGSASYHFYTIMGMWPLIQAAKNNDIDLYSGKFQQMFDAPIQFSMPNQTLPNFNDSTRVSLVGSAPYYELAYARWGKEHYLPLIRKTKRDSDLALWFGVTELNDSGHSESLGSLNSTSSGYSILERGNGEDATWICIKYGPHGGYHGHFDKNNFVLYTRGEEIMSNPEFHRYGSPLHKDWDKTSIAHNVLVANETNQEQATGRSVAFGEISGIPYSITEAGAIYPKLQHYRTMVLLTETLLVGVDQIRASRKNTLDVACHFQGEWTQVPSSQPWTAPQVPGYSYLAGTSSHDAKGGWSGILQTPKGNKVRFILAGGQEDTEAIVGTGPGASVTQRIPLVLLRRKAEKTSFVWAVAMDGAEVQITPSSFPGQADKITAQFTVRSNGETWDLSVRPESRDLKEALEIQIGKPTESQFKN